MINSPEPFFLPGAMRTIKATIAYDGTEYAGWQLQPGRPTVQQAVERAVAAVTGRHVSVLASGRTDAGVHAMGQVIGFRIDSRLPPDVLMRAVNANLPHDVAVLQMADAPSSFHPIRDAVRKRYRYTIHDGAVRDVFGRCYAWHYVYGRLDADAMQRAALPLLGTHDFSSFETSGAERKTSVRTVSHLTVVRGRAGQGRGIGDWGLAKSSDLIAVEIEADGFLYNMVRAIVGTLVEVGRGARPEQWPVEVLQAADRRLAGPTAPPQGLCLMRVDYRTELAG
jgi:tRNA pseudouridine38-40 synthase